MQVRVIEIRDRATFIPAVAIKTDPANEGQRYLIRRSGYGDHFSDVILTRIAGGSGHTTCDPYDWGSGARTMQVAHEWIRDNFDWINDGDVVDVQFILGETKEPKRSERYEFNAN